MKSDESKASFVYKWFVVLIMTILSIQNQWQRYIIAFTYSYTASKDSKHANNPKYEISVQYPQLDKWYGYGLLSGLAFMLSYSICMIFSGLLADKYNRKILIFGSCLLWSSCTLLSGIIDSYWVMFTCRFLLGIFESVFAPCAFSIIADCFPPT